MKILVTGANGLLGQKLVNLLSQQEDVSLVATGKGPNRNPEGSYAYLPCDLTSKSEVSRLILETNPQMIIHTAAMTQVDQCEQNREACHEANVLATEYLIAACEVVSAYFLHVSTDFVFDGTAGPYVEDDLPNPISFYGESKLKAEEVVRKSRLKWAIARTVLVYGIAHDLSRSNIVLWVKNSLEQGKPIQVVNDQWRTPTLAEDLAMGCYLIVKGRHEGIYHLSGEELLTPYDIAIQTADFFGLNKKLITPVDATVFTQPAKRPPKTGFDITKAKRSLGFQPISFQQGLALLATQLEG